MEERWILTSNPLVNPSSGIEQVKQVLMSVTDAALLVEELLAGMGAGGNASQIERLIAAFGNLAAVAIQAAHAVSGRAITPDSVMELLPVTTQLVHPSGPTSATPGAAATGSGR